MYEAMDRPPVSELVDLLIDINKFLPHDRRHGSGTIIPGAMTKYVNGVLGHKVVGEQVIISNRRLDIFSKSWGIPSKQIVGQNSRTHRGTMSWKTYLLDGGRGVTANSFASSTVARPLS